MDGGCHAVRKPRVNGCMRTNDAAAATLLGAIYKAGLRDVTDEVIRRRFDAGTTLIERPRGEGCKGYTR